MPSIRVVLVEPEIGGNIGFIARVMKNFGYTDLFIVRSCLDSDSYKFAGAARDVLENAIIVNDICDAIKDVQLVVGTTDTSAKRSRNLRRYCVSPEELREVTNRVQGEVAILLGRESSGLTNKELDLCDVVVTIPTSELYPAMNISHALAVILYEISKAQAKTSTLKRADKKELKVAVDYFSKVLEAINYPQHKRKIAVKAFKNIVGRATPYERELFLVTGVIRRCLLRLTGKY